MRGSLPFTPEQFFDIFEAYGLALRDVQWIFWMITITALVFILWRGRHSDQFVTALLGLMWLWTGTVYHIYFFSTINKAAYIFGALFLVQSVIFFLSARRLKFRPAFKISSIAAVALLLYGLVAYPLLGEYLGHHYPRRPTLGTPCPTTIFTFAILLFVERQPPFYIYAIPLAWSLIGATAAYLFGVYEDLGLLVAGVGGSVLLCLKPTSDITLEES